jgi:hypothetical protein
MGTDSYQYFGGGHLRERNHLEDLDIEGKIMLQWILEMRIDSAVCSDKWQDCVNIVMNLWFPYSVHNLQANLELSISQE